jgi:LysM repeat protein
MRKDFKYSINQGLPGGANELKKFVKGSISVTGYKSDSPDVNNDFNIIPSNRITMQGVNFPVLGVDDLGYEQMMMPGGEYNFPGNYVTEIPQMGKGGLTQWFAEKWTDVKTGKPCGRSGKEKGSRPYPACRPSKRVNETTPKTTSELSSAEKAKFKREKTSGKRISYNHKRKELGGEAGWLEQYQFAGEPLTAPPIQNKTSFWDLMSYQKDPNNPDNYIKVNKNPNYYRFNTKLNDKGTPEIQAYQNYLNENFNTFIKEDGVWNDETKKAYEEYVVNNQNSKKSNKNKSIKLNTKEPLEFRYENGALQVKTTNPEYNPDLKDWTDLKKLNPTLEEFKAVIDNVPSYNKYYENIYDADNTIRGVQAGPLDKKRQDEIIARKKYQELDPRNKEYLGKTFGNLPIVEKEGIYEGYSPSRIWTTPPGSNSKPWLGDDEVYNPDTDLRYLYFLKPKESSVFTDRQYKEELENLNCINGNCGDEYLNKANSPFSAPVLNLPKKKIKKVLPFPTGDTWKLGQQSYAEMITNPEILKYAKEKGIDLTDLGKDQYSPILAEALIGRRDAEFNNKGVVIPHSREYVPVIQDPNQFDLAGYLPITLDMFSPNMNLNAKNQALLNWDEKSKAEYFRRAGIPEDQWDQVYIHTSPFSINNYIPGKKYGGGLNKYQEGGHIIQPDETFYGIANKYGFNKQELINVNPGLDIDKIRPGQKINLPTVEKIEEVNISSANKKEPTSWYDYINPFNWGAPNYDDAGTFKQAFRKARIEDQNDFMYYGDRYSSDLAQLPENKKDIVKSNDIKITRDYNNDILYKGLSDVQKERRKKLLQSANKIANTQDNSEALEKLLVMTAVMENTLGADKNAYGRTYTRNPMSIDDIAYDDLFKVRKGAKDYTKSQKQAFDWLKTLGYDYRDMDKILRSDDPTAGMAAARLYYGRNTKPLPKENNKDALYNYYIEAYNKGGVDKYKGKSGYKDKWDKYYNLVFPENTEDKKYGGWLDSYQDGGQTKWLNNYK